MTYLEQAEAALRAFLPRQAAHRLAKQILLEAGFAENQVVQTVSMVEVVDRKLLPHSVSRSPCCGGAKSFFGQPCMGCVDEVSA
jgi:hypothetical protein